MEGSDGIMNDAPNRDVVAFAEALRRPATDGAEYLERACGRRPVASPGRGVIARALHRLVAPKVVKPGMDTKSVIARFEAERQASRNWNCSHIWLFNEIESKWRFRFPLRVSWPFRPEISLLEV
jgi:hypothetical protein